MGALLDAKAFHPGRSARNHLRWLAQTNDIPQGRVDAVLDLVGLTAVADRRAGKFSLGMGQRLGIASALLGDPGVLLFDEPVNGLDPEGIRWVRHLLRDLASEGRTVLVSSHLINEMALTAERLVVIGRGTLIAETSVDDFVARHQSDAVRIVTPTPQRFVAALSRAGARPAVDDDGAIVASGLSSADIGELAADQELTVHELTPLRASLEDVFMELDEHLGRVPLAHRSTRPWRRRPAGPLKGTLMTTLPVTARPRHRRRRRRSGPWRAGLRQTMRAEWTKLVSLRSTRWTLLITAVGTLLVTFLATHGALHHSRGWYQGFDPTNQSLAGLAIGSLALGVLGVLAISGEYGSGTIRSSLAAMPRRGVLLTAKVVVVGLGTLVIGEALSFILFFEGQAVLSGGAPTASPRPAGRAAGGGPLGSLPGPLRPARAGHRHRDPSHRRRHRRLRRLHVAGVHPAHLHLGEHRPFRPRAHLRQLGGGGRAAGRTRCRSQSGSCSCSPTAPLRWDWAPSLLNRRDA